MIYCTAGKTATPASVQGIGVFFWIIMDFASPQHFEACAK
jgi:hypothetical protein